MPSPESDALRAHYQDMSDRMAADPDMGLPAVRAMFEQLHTLASEPAGVTYEEVAVNACRALWCIPVDAAGDRVLLYCHGGGFVTNSADSHRKMAAHIAKAAGARALVLDYRRAPEHQCPSQLQDALAAYNWLLTQGYLPSRIASVGDSAGGNLATALVLALRDAGVELPAAIVAISPSYDVDGRERRADGEVRNDAILAKVKSLGLVSLYLGEIPATDPLVNPLRADLSGLPPVYLSCGTHETLRDDAVRFAELAEKAGVSATLDISDGMQHVHTYMAGRASEADATIAAIGDWLRPCLGLV